MSFVILIFIFMMLYVCLKNYASIFSVVSVMAVFFGATTAFLIYGMAMLKSGSTFVVVNTEINTWAFRHFVAAWYIADLFVSYRAIKQYRLYVQVNGK